MLAFPTAAGFLGNELRADWRFPEFNEVFDTHRFLVTDDVELGLGDINAEAFMTIDVGDDFIRLEQIECGNGCHWQATPFNGWWYNDVNNTVPRITGVTFEHSGNVEGLEQTDLFFDNNSVWANFSDITTTGDTYWIQLNVVFIPAPGAFALFGVAAMATRRRRVR